LAWHTEEDPELDQTWLSKANLWVDLWAQSPDLGLGPEGSTMMLPRSWAALEIEKLQAPSCPAAKVHYHGRAGLDSLEMAAASHLAAAASNPAAAASYPGADQQRQSLI